MEHHEKKKNSKELIYDKISHDNDINTPGIDWKQILELATERVLSKLIANDMGLVMRMGTDNETITVSHVRKNSNEINLLNLPVNTIPKIFDISYTPDDIEELNKHYIKNTTEKRIAINLSIRILGELNDNFIQYINNSATIGATHGTISSGIFDFQKDCEYGEWKEEKIRQFVTLIKNNFKDLSSSIGIDALSGRSFIICSYNVSQLLYEFGVLEREDIGSWILNHNRFMGYTWDNVMIYVTNSEEEEDDDDYITLGYAGGGQDIKDGIDSGLIHCFSGDIRYFKNHHDDFCFSFKNIIIPNGDGDDVAQVKSNYFRKILIKNVNATFVDEMIEGKKEHRCKVSLKS